MPMRSRGRWTGLCAAAVLAPAVAGAHPHVWVDTEPTLSFEDGRIVAIRQVWTLDEFVSELIIADFDADGDGDIGPEEADEIARTAFAGMEEYAFFTHAEVDGAPVVWTEATDFRSWLDGDNIVYDFVLPLPEPVDPRRSRFVVGFFDETYFVDVAIVEGVALSGQGTGGCRAEVGPDAAVTIYFGLVHPVRATITCGGGHGS